MQRSADWHSFFVFNGVRGCEGNFLREIENFLKGIENFFNVGE